MRYEDTGARIPHTAATNNRNEGIHWQAVGCGSMGAYRKILTMLIMQTVQPSLRLRLIGPFEVNVGGTIRYLFCFYLLFVIVVY